MKINIKTTNFSLTPAISDYLSKRLEVIKKLTGDRSEVLNVNAELGKISQHHLHGDVFRAEINFYVKGKSIYAKSEKSDLYAAIDDVKDEAVRILKSHKDKKSTLWKKGAQRLKNLIKGNWGGEDL
ncbi:ribosome-associated translation inhibitor RaiA [Candidatus Nomurabacteria bacterium]|nr:ribosome-associated translation inhibitor RaiA [Candidatus Nomurabacteria bacterium]